MNKSSYRLIGMFLMIVSVIFITGGFFFKGDGIPVFLSPLLLWGGIILLTIGVIFYKIIKSD